MERTKLVVIALLLCALAPVSAAAAFTRPLAPGSTGADVQALQIFLQERGFFPLPETTTYFGLVTETALAQFQASVGLEAVGRVGPKTLALLNASTTIATSTPVFFGTLTLGMQGESVSVLQRALRACNFFQYSEITGYFGSITQSSVRAFQTARGLEAVGHVGPATAAALASCVSVSSVDGNGSTSSIARRSGGSGSVRGDTSPPRKPSGLAVNVGDATATLTWNASSDSDTAYFSLYRGTASGFLTLLATTSAATQSYTDVPIHNETTYYYTLTATDASGNESNQTSEVSGTPIGVYDIYVDSVAGSDSNDGSSDYEAFATLAAAQTAAQAVGAGVEIGLKKNSVWREQLTITQSNALIEAYGSGSKPLLDASDAISSSSWSKTSGRTNIYEASVPIDVTTNHGGARWMGVWVNGTRLVEAASVAAADSTAGSYFLSSTSVSPSTLYVHPPSSTNPILDGKTYEYSRRAHGLDTFDATGVTIRGIHGRRNFDSYGSIVLGRNGSAYDIQASEGNTHNILVRANTYVEDLVADEAYAVAGSEIPFIYYESSPPANASVTCVDCTVTRTSGTGTAFYGHTSTGTFGTVTLTNPVVSQVNSSIGFNAANTATLIITNATVTNGATAVKSGAASTTVNTLAFTPSAAGQVVLQTDIASSTWNVSGVSVTSGNLNTGAFFQSSHASTTATITGTTYSSASGRGHFYAVRALQAGFQLTSLQNSFRANSVYYNFANTTNLQYTSNFNTFQTAGTFTIGGTTYSTVADYKTGTGQDANSTGP